MLAGSYLVGALGPDRLAVLEPEPELGGVRHVDILVRQADQVHLDA